MLITLNVWNLTLPVKTTLALRYGVQYKQYNNKAHVLVQYIPSKYGTTVIGFRHNRNHVISTV